MNLEEAQTAAAAAYARRLEWSVKLSDARQTARTARGAGDLAGLVAAKQQAAAIEELLRAAEAECDQARGAVEAAERAETFGELTRERERTNVLTLERALAEGGPLDLAARRAEAALRTARFEFDQALRERDQAATALREARGRLKDLERADAMAC